MAFMRLFVVFIASCVALGGQFGCAAIINGTKQEVLFTSAPNGAVVDVAGQIRKTPATMTLSRKQTYHAVFKLDGYHTETRLLSREVSPWLFLDLGLYLVPGIVSLMHGGAYKIEPSLIHVHMSEIRE